MTQSKSAKGPENQDPRFIYRIEEDGLDGYGNNPYEYVAFDRKLDGDQMVRLIHVLEDAQAICHGDSNTWDGDNEQNIPGDTVDIISLALSMFQEQTGIVGTICDSPLAAVITF